jgi:hypothetical protein
VFFSKIWQLKSVRLWVLPRNAAFPETDAKSRIGPVLTIVPGRFLVSTKPTSCYQSVMHKRFAQMLVIFAACVPSALASINVNTEAIKKSVVYIYGGDNDGKKADPTRIMGTGFLVSVPLLSDAARHYNLLVTARHIVDPAWHIAQILNHGGCTSE